MANSLNHAAISNYINSKLFFFFLLSIVNLYYFSAETAAAFVNENRRQVLDIVTPIAEETAVAFIKQIGNAVLKSIPYSEILPDK
jgi:hypothetical protein